MATVTILDSEGAERLRASGWARVQACIDHIVYVQMQYVLGARASRL